ncbi:MAG: fibronectin type III domain-containing protein [Gallionellaceae bacterium]|nr:MAG: fibronectin type III domain-containing protein [Gallionellaceae bacterium]
MKKYLLLFLSIVLVGCGGGNGSSGSAIPAPGTPTLVTIIGGDAKVTLGWAAVSGATSYNVYYGTKVGVSTAGAKITGATSGNVITGFTNGAAYYFVVTAVNAGGESPVSIEVSATPQVPAPGVPSGVAVIGGDAKVNLGWAAVTGATSYNIYYGTVAGVTTTGTKIAGATSGNAITGLANGVTYYFVVTAVSAGGESPVSSEVSAKPNIPPLRAPSGVTVTGGDAQVNLGWAAVTGATSYNIYYGTVAGVTTTGTKICRELLICPVL